MTYRTGAAGKGLNEEGGNDFPRKQATNCKLKAAEADQPEIVLSTCLFDFTRQPEGVAQLTFVHFASCLGCRGTQRVKFDDSRSAHY